MPMRPASSSRRERGRCSSGSSAPAAIGWSCSTSKRTWRRSKMNRTVAALLSASFLISAASGLHAQEDREAIRKVYDAVHKSFLGIEITLKKKPRLEKAELEE